MFESVLSVCTKFVQLLSLFVTLDSGLCRWHGSGTFPWQRLGVFFTRKKMKSMREMIIKDLYIL
jgi:hypothetical protein